MKRKVVVTEEITERYLVEVDVPKSATEEQIIEAAIEHWVTHGLVGDRSIEQLACTVDERYGYLQ